MRNLLFGNFLPSSSSSPPGVGDERKRKSDDIVEISSFDLFERAVSKAVEKKRKGGDDEGQDSKDEDRGSIAFLPNR